MSKKVLFTSKVTIRPLGSGGGGEGGGVGGVGMAYFRVRVCRG